VSDQSRGSFVRHAAHDPAEAAREMIKALPEDAARAFALECAMLAPSQVPGGLTPKNMATLARLCAELGLDPLGPTRDRAMVERALQHHDRAEGWVPDIWLRQTGRTTRMMLEALAWAEGNNVAVILAPTFGIADHIVHGLRRWSRTKVGQKVNENLFVHANDAEGLYPWINGNNPRAKAFVDHSWYEFAPPRARLEVEWVLSGASGGLPPFRRAALADGARGAQRCAATSALGHERCARDAGHTGDHAHTGGARWIDPMAEAAAEAQRLADAANLDGQAAARNEAARRAMEAFDARRGGGAVPRWDEPT
jgi:hypothetical protein